MIRLVQTSKISRKNMLIDLKVEFESKKHRFDDHFPVWSFQRFRHMMSTFNSLVGCRIATYESKIDGEIIDFWVIRFLLIDLKFDRKIS